MSEQLFPNYGSSLARIHKTKELNPKDPFCVAPSYRIDIVRRIVHSRLCTTFSVITASIILLTAFLGTVESFRMKRWRRTFPSNYENVNFPLPLRLATTIVIGIARSSIDNHHSCVRKLIHDYETKKKTFVNYKVSMRLLYYKRRNAFWIVVLLFVEQSRDEMWRRELLIFAENLTDSELFLSTMDWERGRKYDSKVDADLGILST